MTYTLRKGRHRPAWWWLGFRLWHNKRSIVKRVRFRPDCTYNLGMGDQQDINKLFGIGYLLYHRKDSARFGWWYNADKDYFILSAYCYENGKRTILRLCEMVASYEYDLMITIMPDRYVFTVLQAENGIPLCVESVSRRHKKKWSYPLGLYFGGNRKAPHDMHIELSNL